MADEPVSLVESSYDTVSAYEIGATAHKISFSVAIAKEYSKFQEELDCCYKGHLWFHAFEIVEVLDSLINGEDPEKVAEHWAEVLKDPNRVCLK